jgi:cytochrome c oxidase subunit 3
MMFFAGLVSTYIVLRTGAVTWRPASLPPLYEGLSIPNTVLLCLSGVSMALAQLAVRRGNVGALKFSLWATMALGATFVAIQVHEFQRLMQIVPFHGNVFGSVFYALSGLHGLHVLGGVILLATVVWKASHGQYGRRRETGVIVAALYWYFVVAVWLFLFVALYVF